MVFRLPLCMKRVPASRLVHAMSSWLAKTRRAPSRHSRDARVYRSYDYGHAQTEYTPPPPPPTPMLPSPPRKGRVVNDQMTTVTQARIRTQPNQTQSTHRPTHQPTHVLSHTNPTQPSPTLPNATPRCSRCQGKNEHFWPGVRQAWTGAETLRALHNMATSELAEKKGGLWSLPLVLPAGVPRPVPHIPEQLDDWMAVGGLWQNNVRRNDGKNVFKLCFFCVFIFYPCCRR